MEKRIRVGLNMQKQNSPTTKELREFGIIFGILFILIFGLWLSKKFSGEFNYYLVGAGGLSIILGLVIPKSLFYVYKLWMLIGSILGFIQTRILFGLIFFLLFTPVSIFRKLLSKDSLNLKQDKNLKSYRVTKEIRETAHVERQF
ncbi:MAG: SxtJ family membrane protein [Leptospiraceae bacterium]|nr:SxtJ family membrane protein [Leptospiraceae bacterium]